MTLAMVASLYVRFRSSLLSAQGRSLAFERFRIAVIATRARGQKRSCRRVPLPNNLIGANQQRLRDREAKCLGGP
jgi:hypothetical protein